MELRMTNGCSPSGLMFGRWNRVFDELTGGAAATFAPRADVIEDADGYHFYFEVPGLKSDSVDVRVEDGSLIVEAERKRPEWSKDAQIRVAERAYGKLHRAFELPEDARHEGIAAAYKDGVLEVTVPKKPESKPFKVKVQFES